jgi:UDP-glucose 4-epimerase
MEMAAGQRIVVTGGAGFIGRHIAETYASRGAHVLVIDDLSSGSAAIDGSLVRTQRIDIADPSVVPAIRRFGPDLVVHCAAQVSVARSVREPEFDRRVNVDGTALVVEAAETTRARVVFLSSGGAIYGECDGATEATPPAPASPYGRHKLEAEDRVRQADGGHGILRLANIYGPGQRPGLEGGVVAIFAEQLRSGRPVVIHGSGGQTRDFVHVDDVVGAVLAAGCAPVSGTWNVGTGIATSIRKLLQEMAAISGRAPDVVEAQRREGDVTTSRLDSDLIRRQLGWQPQVNLADGLRGLLLT